MSRLKTSCLKRVSSTRLNEPAWVSQVSLSAGECLSVLTPADCLTLMYLELRRRSETAG